MALEDINSGERYCWYDAAYGKLNRPVGEEENDFGSGEERTTYAMNKWDNEDWGPQNDNKDELDMFGVIKEEVTNGWFVPSKSEWSAFGCMANEEMGVTTTNYSEYDLSSSYWSSSQDKSYFAYVAQFNVDYCASTVVYGVDSVRLSTTF